MTKRNSTGASAPKQAKNQPNKRKTTSQFILDAKAVHGERYTYEKVNYVRAKSKVVIGCREHGYFEQAPTAHLAGKGCVLCGISSQSAAKRKTTSQFINEAQSVHGDRYCYETTVYFGARERLSIKCRVHGVFQQTAGSHLIGSDCPKCALKKTPQRQPHTKADFVKLAMAVHGDRYGYDYVDYTNNHTGVDITCRVHGNFKQTPNNHTYGKGKGCPDCANELKGFDRTLFTERCAKNNNEGTFYVLECFKGGERFYKVGITCNDIKQRYSSSTKMPYDYHKSFIMTNNSIFIYDLELRVKAILRKYRHKPSIHFEGHTECFTTIKPIERLLKRLSSTEQLQLLA